MVLYTKSIPILGYRRRKTKISVQGSIDSIRSKTYSPCNEACHILRETLFYPYILHLTYPTRDANGHSDIPDFLEKEITIDGTCYDIVGAVYGNGYTSYLDIITMKRFMKLTGWRSIQRRIIIARSEQR
jgi:hypothetical protein